MSTKVSCLKNILRNFGEYLKKSSPSHHPGYDLNNALRASCPREEIPCLVIEMAKEQIPVGDHLFNEAFNVSWETRNQQEALKILDIMARQGFPAYTNIIRLHCRSNRVEIADGMLLSMATKGSSHVNIVSAKVILNAYVHAEKYTEAYTFFQRVTKDLSEYVKVDASFYTSMMIGCLKGDNVVEAFNLLDHMEEKKIETEDYVYYCLFNWLCKKTHYKEAEDMFLRMKKCGVVPDIETHNSLLYGYLVMEECEKAEKHVKEMVNLCVPVTYRVVSHVVTRYMANEIHKLLDPFVKAELVAADIISLVRKDWAKAKKWKKGSVFVDDVEVIQP